MGCKAPEEKAKIDTPFDSWIEVVGHKGPERVVSRVAESENRAGGAESDRHK